MEFDCTICGTPVYAPPSVNGCTIFCEDCYNDKQLMDWYRTRIPVKGARQEKWEADHAAENRLQP